jgi:hypothetical protein
VAWDAPSRTFFVSSLRNGTIGQVALDGSYRVFATAPFLVTTSGMLIDRVRNRLLLCNEDVGFGERSRPETRNKLDQVVAFDLTTGHLKRIYDLSGLVDGPHLPNDLTMDMEGNIYVTDSFSPVIYRIDVSTGAASVLVRADRLMPADAGPVTGSKPYLNGIGYNPGGYLIAADYARGKLWKVPLANPSEFTEVRLAERLKGPDGLVMRSTRELIAVQTFPGPDGNIAADIEQLVSDDGWASARVVSTAVPLGISGATTGTLRDGEIWFADWYRRSRPKSASSSRSCARSISPMPMPVSGAWVPRNGCNCTKTKASRAWRRSRSGSSDSLTSASSSQTPRSAPPSSTCKSAGRN